MKKKVQAGEPVLKQLRLFNQINSDLKKVEKELRAFIKPDFPILEDSSVHLLDAGGKRLRPAFALLAGKFYDYPIDKLLPVAMSLELIHMATLVHDDVVDDSLTRRGKPTVKAKWGNVVSIATGDYLLSKALELLAKIDNPEVSRILADVSVEMSQGEIQQINSSFDVNQNLKQYYYRIKRKTALLISASCKLGALVCDAPKRQVWALGAYGHALGMAFQIVDDILDVTSEAATLGKPIGGDIRQGIMTLPIILSIKLTDNKEHLYKLLRKTDKTDDEVHEVINIIKKSGAIEESKKYVDLYYNKAKNHLQELPNIPTRKALEDLALFVKERSF